MRLSLGFAVEGVAGVSTATGPHIPMTTSAGHFLSMQPAQGVEPRAAVWYRGTDWDIVAAEREKFKRALEAIIKLFDACVDEPTTMMLMAEVAEEALK